MTDEDADFSSEGVTVWYEGRSRIFTADAVKQGAAEQWVQERRASKRTFERPPARAAQRRKSV